MSVTALAFLPHKYSPESCLTSNPAHSQWLICSYMALPTKRKVVETHSITLLQVLCIFAEQIPPKGCLKEDERLQKLCLPPSSPLSIHQQFEQPQPNAKADILQSAQDSPRLTHLAMEGESMPDRTHTGKNRARYCLFTFSLARQYSAL